MDIFNAPGNIYILIAIAVVLVILIILSIVAKRANIKELYKQNDIDNTKAEATTQDKANLNQVEEKAVLSLEGENPETIAAVMGALMFTMEEGANRSFSITSVIKGSTYIDRQDSWALSGRNRLMYVRQDFTLNKRRKAR